MSIENQTSQERWIRSVSRGGYRCRKNAMKPFHSSSKNGALSFLSYIFYHKLSI